MAVVMAGTSAGMQKKDLQTRFDVSDGSGVFLCIRGRSVNCGWLRAQDA
jgi:hypothetical protein